MSCVIFIIITYDFSGGQSQPYIHLSSILTKELQLGRLKRFLLQEDPSLLPSSKLKPTTEMNNNLVGFSMVQTIPDSVDHLKGGDGGQKEDIPMSVLALGYNWPLALLVPVVPALSGPLLQAKDSPLNVEKILDEVPIGSGSTSQDIVSSTIDGILKESLVDVNDHKEEGIREVQEVLSNLLENFVEETNLRICRELSLNILGEVVDLQRLQSEEEMKEVLISVLDEVTQPIITPTIAPAATNRKRKYSDTDQEEDPRCSKRTRCVLPSLGYNWPVAIYRPPPSFQLSHKYSKAAQLSVPDTSRDFPSLQITSSLLLVLADILEDSIEVEVQHVIDDLLEDLIATEAKKYAEMLAIGRDIMAEIVAGMSFPELEDATTADLVEEILHETITNAMEHSTEDHMGQVIFVEIRGLFLIQTQNCPVPNSNANFL